MEVRTRQTSQDMTHINIKNPYSGNYAAPGTMLDVEDTTDNTTEKVPFQGTYVQN